MYGRVPRSPIFLKLRPHPCDRSFTLTTPQLAKTRMHTRREPLLGRYASQEPGKLRAFWLVERGAERVLVLIADAANLRQ